MQSDKCKTADALDPGTERKQNSSFVSLEMGAFIDDKLHVELKTHIL